MICSKSLSISVAALPEPLEWFKFDELSGNRVGSILGTILTETADPIGSAPGKISLAAQCASGAALLESAASVPLRYQGGGFDCFGWFQFTTLAVGSFAQLAYYESVGQKGFELFFSPAGFPLPTGVQVNVRGDSGAPSEAVTNPLVIVAGDWIFWRVFYDPVAQRFGVQINNGAVTLSSVRPLSAQADGFFYVAWFTCDGRCDESGIFAEKLTDSQASEIYNAGSGRTFP